MKKIDKTQILATEYKKWIDRLNNTNKNHPKYISSNHRYYKDIVGNLLWVQRGLCAYTEMYLCKENEVAENKWRDGKITKLTNLGALDHYDSTLKTTKGWEWDNFFVIHSDVNSKIKRDKKVNYKLKPDLVDYDPFDFLDYDLKSHHFYPNAGKSIKDQNLIKEDIIALGLNYQPIIDYRKDTLKPLIDEVSLGLISIAEAKRMLNKFYTAFEMSIINLGLEN